MFELVGSFVVVIDQMFLSMKGKGRLSIPLKLNPLIVNMDYYFTHRFILTLQSGEPGFSKIYLETMILSNSGG
jgi:hypothetical protein